MNFFRKVSVKVLYEEVTEYYTDKERMNDEGIPDDTGINNSDIELGGEGESIDSTEMELQEIR